MNSLVLVGVIVGGGLILLLSIWAFLNRNYIRIAPNTAAVIFGRKNKSATNDASGKALTKGYIETSADVILSPQQAYNFSETLKTAISEYEVTVEARMAARRESTKDVK